MNTDNQTTTATAATTEPLHTYIAYFNGKQLEVQAPTSYQAQQRAAMLWGVGKRSWKVTVMLARKADGQDVVHSTASL